MPVGCLPRQRRTYVIPSRCSQRRWPLRQVRAFAEALGMLQRLDAGGEPLAESLNLRADICAQMGRDRDAAAIYGELLKRGHADEALHYKYAHSLFKAGAVNAALSALEPALCE